MKTICILLCLLYLTYAYKLYERTGPPRGWSKEMHARSSDSIKFTLALKQYNMDQLEAIVLANSDPSSPSYGNHMSAEEILELIAPSVGEVLPVLDWLTRNGVEYTWSGDFISAEASVAKIESLFSTEMFLYRHDNGKTRILNHGAIHIPDHLSDIIALVSGLAEFPYFKSLRVHEQTPNYTDPGIVVVQVLQALYNLPAEFPVHPNSSVCLAEFMDDSSYNDTDLANFAQEMNIPPFSPSVIIGPYDGECELFCDFLRYGGAVALKTPLWFWTAQGWMYEFSIQLFNSTTVPDVVSMSWGWPEPWQCQPNVGNCSENGWTSADYVDRCNKEYIKLAARGVTMVAASGDQGAPGDMNPDCSETGKKSLSNLFPASSPWVLAVGATMLAANGSQKINYEQPPMCNEMPCATNGTEVVCSIPEALITSGGGFSSYSPLPSWQAQYVQAYLNSSVQLPPKKDFNATNRAFPDISALGHNFVIMWGGMAIQVDGTSCSAPVVAGMIALLNSARYNNGKSRLGFINPLLYKAASQPGVYNDNKCTENCCSQYGFQATRGWDPVTGLGSPNFPLLLKIVQALP